MDEANYLAYHRDGVGGLLGINFPSVSKESVISELAITPRHFAADGMVNGGIIMALADAGGSYAAILNLAPGEASTVIDSNVNFLGPGSGDVLVGETRAVRISEPTSVWRTRVYQGADTCIAEVTQTRIAVAEAADDRSAGAAKDASTELEKETEAGGDRKNGGPRKISEERRKQIFDGACAVIAAKGFAKATIREIAAASGMPVPTMYQYIDGKEDLLFLIYESFMGDINARVRASVSSDLSPTENLKRAIRANMECNDEYHRYIKLMFQETRALSPEGRKRVDRLDGDHVGIWRAILKDGIAAGEFDVDGVELMANYIFYLCGVWALRYWSIGGHGFEAVSDSLSRFVLRAVVAPGAEPDTKVA